MQSIEVKKKLFLKLSKLISDEKGLETKDIEVICQGMDLGLKCSNTIFAEKLMHLAFEKKNFKTFNAFIDKGVDINSKDAAGHTVFHKNFYFKTSLTGSFSWKNKKDIPDLIDLETSFTKSIISAIIKQNNPLNLCDPDGLTYFHIVCASDNIEAVTLFLNSGVPVDLTVTSNRFEKYTGLHFAVLCTSLNVSEILLKHGAKINLKNNEGKTPLHMCIEKNISLIDAPYTNHELVDKNEAILNLLLLHDTEKEFPHLFAVSAMKNSDALEKLLAQRVDVNQCISMDSKVLPGYAALHFAAHVNVDTVKLLLKNGANIETKTAFGETSFTMCVYRYKVEDIVDIINLVPYWKDILMSDGKTKLVDVLLAFKDSDAIKHFLQQSKDNIDLYVPWNSLLFFGLPVLHIAIIFSERAICKSNYKKKENNCFNFEPDLTVITECLNQGADVTITDKLSNEHNWTPIHFAFRHQKWNVVNLLFEYHRGSKNCIDKENLSHLHIACILSNRAAVQKLLRNGAIANVAYHGNSLISYLYSGWTPLHIAVSTGDCETVKRLLDSGANPHTKDSYFFTPIHLIIKHNHPLASALGKILLSSPILQDHIVENLNLSYLHIACLTKNINAVRKLLDLGVDINKVFSCKNFNSAYYCINPSSLEACNGNTPFHFVLGNLFPLASRKSKSAKLEIVKLLLQKDADILAKNSAGVSPFATILISEDHDLHCIDAVITTLKNNNPLRRLIESEFGLTLLHLACRKVDFDLTKELLDNGFKVNVQAHESSSIWPRYTPLHVLIMSFRYFHYFIRKNNNVGKIFRFLLNRGADVTLLNTKQHTPLYSAYHMLCTGSDDSTYLVNLLLKAHRNFEINPISSDGISHFHIACHVLNVVSVKNFLENDVDVNLAIDASCDTDISSCSPLLLALKANDLLDTDSTLSMYQLFVQLEIINLLIKHGANVKVADGSANTPLHHAAMYESQRENLIQLLIKSGADVNATNMQEETPLELLLKNKKTKIDEIRNFITLGCNFNAFNVMTEIGYIAMATSNFDHEDMQSLLLGLFVNFPDLMKVDTMNRTVIHNIVSIQDTKISAEQFVDLFDICKKFGYDIDDRDYLGRTALHMAALFRNEKAIAGLLLAGADINITDNSHKIPFTYIFQTCPRCINIGEVHLQFYHIELFKKFITHVKIMNVYDFDVHRSYENLIDKIFELYRYFDEGFEKKIKGFIETDVDKFCEQVTEMMQLEIESYKFVIGDFILGTAVIDYPTMSRSKREAIDEYFQTNKSQLNDGFSDAAGILRLQYRQAVRRREIIDSAKDSLSVLMKFRLPEICSHIILKFLKNTELQNMILLTSLDVKKL